MQNKKRLFIFLTFVIGGLVTWVNPSVSYIVHSTNTGNNTSQSDVNANKYHIPGSVNKLSYQVNKFTGSLSYTIPFTIPKGRNGLAPSIQLVYSSQSGISWPARGWSIPITCIQRETKKGIPTYNDDIDKFIFMGNGRRLELVKTNETNPFEYKAKIENSFNKYIYYQGDKRWEVLTKSGHVMKLGTTDASRHSFNNGNTVFSWCIDKMLDSNKNTIKYKYIKNTTTTPEQSSELYIEEISYTGNDQTQEDGIYKVKFETDVELLPGTIPSNRHFSYRSGFKIITIGSQKLQAIVLEANYQERKRLSISYGTLDHTNNDLVITKIEEKGTSKDSTTTLLAPPLTLKYTSGSNDFAATQNINGVNKDFLERTYYHGSDHVSPGNDNKQFTLAALIDMNGDGLKDFVDATRFYSDTNNTNFNEGDEWLPNTNGFPGTRFSWAVSLQQTNGSFADPIKWFFQIAAGALDQCDFCAIRESKSGSGLSNTNANTFDMDGDGKPDYLLLRSSVNPSRICKNLGNNFNTCLNFPNPNLSFGQSVTGFGATLWDIFDINGDGLPDFVQSDTNITNNNVNWNVIPGTGTNLNSTPITWPSTIDHCPTSAMPKPIICGEPISESTENVNHTQMYVDVNGDGLPDRLVLRSENRLFVHYNTGAGFRANAVQLTTDSTQIGWEEIKGLMHFRTTQISDVDGDGLPDILIKDTSASDSNTLVLKVRFNRGYHGFSSAVTWNIDTSSGSIEHHLKMNDTTSCPSKTAGSGKPCSHFVRRQIMDLNGDGKIDLVFTDGTQWKIRKGIYPPPYMLKEINNGKGLKVSFTYKPSTSFSYASTNTTKIPYTNHVVSSVTLEDFGSSSGTTTYSYYNGKYDHMNKEFRGFQTVTVTAPNGRRSSYSYRQGEYDHGLPWTEMHSDPNITSPPYIQLIEYTLDEKVINSSTTPQVKFPFIKTKLIRTAEHTSQEKALYLQFDYDSFGNMTKKINHTWDLCQRFKYKSNTSNGNYIFALKETSFFSGSSSQSQLESCDDSGTLTQERVTKYFHDNNNSDNTLISNGNITLTEKCGDIICTPTLSSKTFFTYYPTRGLLKTVSDPNGSITTFEYDTLNLFVTKKTNVLGHTIMYVYDHGLGLLELIKGPNSTSGDVQATGAEVIIKYDELGRPIEKKVPTFNGSTYVSKTSKTWEYSLPTASLPHFTQTNTFKVLDDPSSAIKEVSFYNGRGQVIQTRETHLANGDVSVMDKFYDSLGNLTKASKPYTSQGFTFTSPNTNIPSITMEYDLMQRLTKLTHSDNTFVTYEYLPWQKKITDESGKIKEYLYNAIGKLETIKEHENTIAQQVFLTSYTYTSFGELSSITDAQGNIVSFNYNQLGQKTGRFSSPASTGMQSQEIYTYDKSGLLISKTDNSGLTSTYLYDPINRLKEITYPNVTFQPNTSSNQYPLGQNSNFKTIYTYDDPSKLHSVGLLTRVDDTTGHTEFEFDALGRTTNKTINHCQSWSFGNCVTHKWYTLEFEYNAIAPTKIIHHTANTPIEVKYDFDIAGRISHVTLPQNGNASVSTFVYNPDDTVAQKVSNYNTNITYTYNLRGNLIESKGVKINNSSYTIFHHDYQYMASGHIDRFRDLKNSHEFTYGYDDLYRLISMYSEQLGNRFYGYSPNGNLSSKITDNFTNNTFTSYDYIYEGSNPSPPPQFGSGFPGAHGVRLLNISTFTPTGQSNDQLDYSYGYNGNMKRRESNNTNQRWRYFYDVTNKLRLIYLIDKNTNTISQETEIAYQYDGTRLHKKTTQSTIIKEDNTYIGDLIEHNRITNTYDVHVFANGTRVASIRDAGNSNQIYLYHQNQTMGTTAVTNSNGDIVDERGYFPYGTQYNLGIGPPQSGLKYQFNSKELDDFTGLYYYGARYYDPMLSRWLSSDKYMFFPDAANTIKNPQHLNLFSFSLNNPINKLDPNGQKTIDPDEIDRDVNGKAKNAPQKSPTNTEVALGVAKGVGAVLGVAIVGGMFTASFSYLVALVAPDFVLSPSTSLTALSFSTPVAMGTKQVIQNIALTVNRNSAISEMVKKNIAHIRNSLPETIYTQIDKITFPEKVQLYKEAMLRGEWQFNHLDSIAGTSFRGGGFIIMEGNHRMAAAIQIFKETGNNYYVQQFLKYAADKSPQPHEKWYIMYQVTKSGKIRFFGK